MSPLQFFVGVYFLQELNMGVYTIRQVLQMTQKFYPSRMQNRLGEQSRLKHFEFYKIVNHRQYALEDQIATDPSDQVSYRIVASIKPQYEIAVINGIKRVVGRHIPDSYKIIFETDKLSLDTQNWKIRLGSGCRYVSKPPLNQLVSYPKAGVRNKVFKNKNDWNALVLGINADFVFRCAYTYYEHGHLYGNVDESYLKNPPIRLNGNHIMFFPKHIVNFFELLLYRGILKEDVSR